MAKTHYFSREGLGEKRMEEYALARLLIKELGGEYRGSKKLDADDELAKLAKKLGIIQVAPGNNPWPEGRSASRNIVWDGYRLKRLTPNQRIDTAKEKLLSKRIKRGSGSLGKIGKFGGWPLMLLMGMLPMLMGEEE